MDLQAPPPSPIKDGTEATFMADVIEASAEVPVIVDFWAPWCGPCKTLTPALEKAVTEAKGKVRLVKIDVDQNQRIAAQMRVQSIPAVFAFVGGQPVDGFMGAQSPAQIKAFVDRLIAMSGGNAGLEEALAAAEEMLAEGAAADAAQTFAAILQEDEGNVAALSGLARAYLALGDTERAKGVLELTPKGKENDPAIAAARAQIELAEASAGAGEAGDLDGRGRAQPERPPGALSTSRWRRSARATARARSTRCSSCSAATASGTTARPRRSSSSCSTASARRARRRRRAGGA